MTDAVTTTVLCDTAMRYEVQLTNISDGTGEAAVLKIDLSALVGNPESLALEKVSATVGGFEYVVLYRDRTVDTTLLVLPTGRTAIKYKPSYLKDPFHGQAGTTGDITLTTGPIMTDIIGTYDIMLRFKKKF